MPKEFSRILSILLTSLAVVLEGCGGGGSSSPPDNPSPAPAAPTGLSAVPGDRKVTLSWNAVPNATSYSVYRAETPWTTWSASLPGAAVQANLTATTLTVTGLTNITANTGSGTLFTTGTTAVVGSGTDFTAQLKVGAMIAAKGETRTITAIADATHMTVDRPFSPSLSGAAFTYGMTYWFAVSASGSAGEGGQSAQVSATASDLGRWDSKAVKATTTVSSGVGVANGRIYVFGGQALGAGTVSTAESYDPVSNSWTPEVPMPTPRGGLGVGVLNGVLYAVGGGNGSTPVATVEAYDPVTNTWTSKAPMPTARGNLAVAVVNGILYAVGGETSGSILATVEAYDPVANSWTARAPVPTVRQGLAAAGVNGTLYAVGGFAGPTITNSAFAVVEAYDPATNTWTTKAPMPTGRNWLAATEINGLLYAVGGYNGLIYLKTNEVYDPASNTWTTRSSMPTTLSNAGIGVLNGVLYAIGGISDNRFINANYAFTPAP